MNDLANGKFHDLAALRARNIRNWNDLSRNVTWRRVAPNVIFDSLRQPLIKRHFGSESNKQHNA